MMAATIAPARNQQDVCCTTPARPWPCGRGRVLLPDIVPDRVRLIQLGLHNYLHDITVFLGSHAQALQKPVRRHLFAIRRYDTKHHCTFWMLGGIDPSPQGQVAVVPRIPALVHSPVLLVRENQDCGRRLFLEP